MGLFVFARVNWNRQIFGGLFDGPSGPRLLEICDWNIQPGHWVNLIEYHKMKAQNAPWTNSFLNRIVLYQYAKI